MVAFRQRFLNDESQIGPSGPGASQAADDGQLLDAFSRTVVNVAELLRPAVVHLRASRSGGGGRGRVSFLRPTDFCSPTIT